MNFSIETGVPVLTVFLQGLLSFFSPCILPLIPLYVGYLAGGAKSVSDDGEIVYPRRKVVVNTLFFVLGISAAFFILGLGFTALGKFFSDNRLWFARISGVIMIAFGFYQLTSFGKIKPLEKERRLPLRLDRWSMGPVPALLLGFTFSFAWTPCVGPTLGSVLLMAGSAETAANGFLLIGVYALGFIIPFLAVGFFTGAVLNFFKKHRNVVKYTVKIGAVLMIVMGVMTLTGFMNGFTGYLSGGTASIGEQSQAVQPKPSDQPEESHVAAEASESTAAEKEDELPDAPDFTLKDQFGREHTLSEYKGKTVFLNFWATWCPPCRGEMPEIQALYEKYGNNETDLAVIGVAGPNMGGEGSEADIKAFLDKNGYSFPVVMDETGAVFAQYGIRSFPTTFMIDSKGKIFGYVESALTGDIMESIVQQTMNGKRA